MLFARTIQTVDSHTEGNSTRIVLGGVKVPPGRTVAERNDWLKMNDDGLRRLLNFEPRGHPMMCSVYVFPPVEEGSDFSVIITEQDEYVPMSGHCIIGTATTIVATGMVPAHEPETTVTFDTLAGKVVCRVAVENGKTGRVRFDNVESFLLHRDVVLRPFGKKPVPVDVAYGGCFYAIVDADALGLELSPGNDIEIIAWANEIVARLNEEREIVHPFVPGISRCYQTLFASKRTRTGDIRQVIVAPPGALDRSPCGTGASAHLATMVARGTVDGTEPVRFEGLLHTVFSASVLSREIRDGLPVIRPEVSGRAYITGFHSFVLEHDDPLPEGFRIGHAPRNQNEDAAS